MDEGGEYEEGDYGDDYYEDENYDYEGSRADQQNYLYDEEGVYEGTICDAFCIHLNGRLTLANLWTSQKVRYYGLMM